MAILVAAVANGGTLYRPLIVKAIETADGGVVQDGAPHVAGRLDISAKTLTIIREGLWEVVNGKKGTARKSRLKEIEMCGKTGTAQVVGRKEGQDDKKKDGEEVERHLRDHAWFVAYAPARNPQIAVAVIVEHGEHGSTAAAPVASEIIQFYLDNRDAAYQAGQDDYPGDGYGDRPAPLERRLSYNR